MSIINMLRGGVATGDVSNGHMYPRPDYKLDQMAENKGWEKLADSFHMVERMDFCECSHTGGIERAKAADPTTDECCIEVGDEIAMVWIPNRFTVTAFTLDIVQGVTGLVVGLARYSVPAGANVISGAVAVDTPLTGSVGDPLPGTVVDQSVLDGLTCKDRLPFDDFCTTCESDGCFYQEFLPSPELIGGCAPEGQYLSLVIEALPDGGLCCTDCCPVIDVGARVLINRMGT